MQLLRFASIFSALAATISTLAIPAELDLTSAPHDKRWVCESKPAGRLFNIDGKTQYFSGVNAWWLGHLRNNVDVDEAITTLKNAGQKVARVWAFGSTNNAATETEAVYYQVLNSSGQFFNLNPINGIPRLDYAIAQAEKANIKLILPFLNNFDALGGINTYTNVYGGDHNSFYTNTAAQNAYKKYIKLIINRYKNSPAIFSWELCNEPRCSGCPTSVITNWATTISKYIKSLDAKHMVSLGDEGWLASGGDGSYAYSGYEGVDFAKNLAIPTLDYGTVHMYPNQWGYNYSWGNTWISQHNAIGKAANKPVLLEEYAAPSPALRAEFIPQYQSTVLSKTSIAGSMVWQFGKILSDGGNPSDEYAVYYDADPASEFQKLLVKHARDMSAKPAYASF